MQSHLLQMDYVLILDLVTKQFQKMNQFVRESPFRISDAAVEISSPTATSKSIQSKSESKPAFCRYLNSYKAIDIMRRIFQP